MTLNDDHALETYKSMIAVGTEALKALQFINGGAIVALLAYLGQASDRAQLAPQLIGSFGFLLGGLVAATLAFLGVYLTQFALWNEINDRKSGLTSHFTWLVATIGLDVISLGCFAKGAFMALAAFSQTQ